MIQLTIDPPGLSRKVTITFEADAPSADSA